MVVVQVVELPVNEIKELKKRETKKISSLTTVGLPEFVAMANFCAINIALSSFGGGGGCKVAETVDVTVAVGGGGGTGAGTEVAGKDC